MPDGRDGRRAARERRLAPLRGPPPLFQVGIEEAEFEPSGLIREQGGDEGLGFVKTACLHQSERMAIGRGRIGRHLAAGGRAIESDRVVGNPRGEDPQPLLHQTEAQGIGRRSGASGGQGVGKPAERRMERKGRRNGRRGFSLGLGPLTRFGDARGRDRMGAQVFRYRLLGAARCPRQSLEHSGHGLRIEAGAGEDLDADAVGFVLVLAGVVDRLLLEQRETADDDRLRGVVGAPRARGEGAEHAEQDRQRGPLHVLMAPEDVPLGYVRDLVGQHRREFIFATGREDESGVSGDQPPGAAKALIVRSLSSRKRKSGASVSLAATKR